MSVDTSDVLYAYDESVSDLKDVIEDVPMSLPLGLRPWGLRAKQEHQAHVKVAAQVFLESTGPTVDFYRCIRE